MFPSLEDSQRFKEDFEKYRSAIAVITDKPFKDSCNLSLQNLLRAVRSIDEFHKNLSANGDLATNLQDMRTLIVESRKDLDRKLKDWSQRH